MSTPPVHRLVLGEAPESAILAAAELLVRDGLVVFPTESFYGIAARADSETAVSTMAELKDRVGRKPIPLVAASIRDVERIGPIPTELAPLADRFWPGPLTLAIPPTGRWPAPLLGNTGTLGVRIPDHPVARRLAAAAGGLITASSANLAGESPAVSPDELPSRLLRAIQGILDGGRCVGGLPSTVVGVRDGGLVVFREGAVTRGELEQVSGCRVEG